MKFQVPEISAIVPEISAIVPGISAIVPGSWGPEFFINS